MNTKTMFMGCRFMGEGFMNMKIRFTWGLF